MKNLKINKTKIKALALSGLILVSSSAFIGCGREVYTDETEIYDYINPNSEEIVIEPQILDVPGETFKLVIEYSVDADARKKWRITDNKKLYTKVYTQGLPEGKKVYIDNVHTDTSIVSTKEQMNGITQDSMDDRIHNSLMYGFPISDTVSFYGVNEIEGQNSTFITGSFYGFSGYSSVTIDEERYKESDYLKAGVYANKISSSYGLLIQDGDLELSSDILVLVSNTIEKKYDNGKVEITEYDRNGKSKVKTKSAK